MTRRRVTVWLAALSGVAAIVVTSAQSAATKPACPRQSPQSVQSSRPGASQQLVPSGATSLVLCRYDGPFGSSGRQVRLVAVRTVPDPQRLAGALNRLPRASGTYGCPVSSGAVIVAHFGYAGGPADPVRIELTGCWIVSNGRVAAWADRNGNTILDRLEALVHAQPERVATNRATATIAGFIRLCGGAAPGHCFISTIGSCDQGQGCVESDRVVAIGTEGRQVAQGKIRMGKGRFRLRVPPGAYTVELLGDGRRVHYALLQAQGATARAGHATRVVFTFDVK